MAIDPRPGVESWSFGMPLCVEEADETAALVEVGPVDTVGSGFEFVGALIHEYAPATGDSGIISLDGFPPSSLDGLVPVEGYVLDVPCTTGQDRAVELVIGLRMSGPDGGGWLGADLSYHVGERHYVLQIRNDMLICGESVTEFCGGPPPS